MKKFIITWIAVLSLSVASAQNLVMADYKPIHFGFTLGMNVLDFGVKQSNLLIDGKVYHADVSNPTPGFSVGVIGDVRLGNYFNFRLIPSLHFGDRTVRYSNDTDDEVIAHTIKSTIISVPAYFKFSGARIKDYRPYLIAGGGVSFDLARDKTAPILLEMGDYFIDFGAGCTIYFPFFRFSPELRFAMGFNNVITPWDKRKGAYVEPEYEKFSTSISKLTTKMFILTFNFE